MAKSKGRRLFKWLLILTLLALGLGAGGACGLIFINSRDLPSLQTLEDYQPAVTSRVFDKNGEVVARFYSERRTVVPIERIPKHVKDAFIGAEDSEFYSHEGIDYPAILAVILNEAKVKVLGGGNRRGGGTITMQTARTFLLTRERTYKRKIKEMLLAKRIEDQLSKDEILHLYLNQIYFGNGAYGVEEAAQTYYGVSISNVTIGQAAALASIPKSPSRINPIVNPRRMRARRAYVLTQMVKHNLITQAQADKANNEAIRFHVKKPEYLNAAPYYAEEIRRQLVEQFGKDVVTAGGLKVYSAMDAHLQVTAKRAVEKGLREVDKRQGWRGPQMRLNPDEVKLLVKALDEERERRFPVEETPELKKASLKERPIWDLSRLSEKATRKYLEAGPQKDPDEDVWSYPPMLGVRTTTLEKGLRLGAVIVSVDDTKREAIADLGTVRATIPFSTMKWARPFNPEKRSTPPRKPSQVVKKGDVVWVTIDSLKSDGKETTLHASLDQEPRVQGAFVAIDPHTHKVLALVGGYRFSRSSFNRATQAKRQAGSSFKPFIYAQGIDSKAFTPVGFLSPEGSRLITDAPKVYFDRWTGKKWAPKNSGGKFRGDITLRTCLTHSVNTCSISILETVGVDRIAEFADDVGLMVSKKQFPRNLTLALGTADVIPIDLVNAYSIFPGEGLHAPPILIEKIVTKDGKSIEQKRPVPKQVLAKESAYIMSEMMKSVVESGTATGAKVLGRSVAGKTGTTNLARSVWFVGFSPDIVGGAYVGFDNNDPLGHREYGGKAALPIWVDFMKVALKKGEGRDFVKPEGISEVYVSSKTGLRVSMEKAQEMPEGTLEGAEEGDVPPPGAQLEFFIEGTAPMMTEDDAALVPLDLLDSDGGLGP